MKLCLTASQKKERDQIEKLVGQIASILRRLKKGGCISDVEFRGVKPPDTQTSR